MHARRELVAAVTLQQEQRDTAGRIDALTKIINGPKWGEFDRAERARIVRHLSVLEQLDHVLLERIAAAERKP